MPRQDAAIGNLAVGIAHDFTTSSAASSASGFRLLEDLPQKDAIHDVLHRS